MGHKRCANPSESNKCVARYRKVRVDGSMAAKSHQESIEENNQRRSESETSVPENRSNKIDFAGKPLGTPSVSNSSSISLSELSQSNRIKPHIRDNKKKNVRAMVLQLVLPSTERLDNNNYLDNNNTIEEILCTNHSKRRTPTVSGSTNRPNFYPPDEEEECYVNPNYSHDLPEYGRNFSIESVSQSPVVSISSGSDVRKSTNPQEKTRLFRKHLTGILSFMYSLFIFTLGLVIYISDVVLGNSPIAEAFTLYLVIIAFIFLLYLIIDIRIYMNKRNLLLQKNVIDRLELKAPSTTANYHMNITIPEAENEKLSKHHYCFSKDRHSANFYLKVGAAGFCLGHLIHSGLLLGYQILFLTSDGEAFYECATVISIVLDIAYPVYSFFLLYFIFKYSNIIINRHMVVMRFGLMHCISSSLCFWVWTILRETVESLSNHDYENASDVYPDDSDLESVETEDREQQSELAFLRTEDMPLALPLTSYNKKGAEILTAYLNTSVRQFSGVCKNDAGLGIIYRNYSPYLYPFSVEYSILVVGILFVIWQSIGKCKENKKEEEISRRECDSVEGNNNGDYIESNIVIHADCHSANKGLFGGIVIMVLTAVSIILFLIAIHDERYGDEAVSLNLITSITIIFLMTVTGLFAYRQITKLDINTEHVSILDDLLLFISIPSFFLNGIAGIIPAVLSRNPLSIALVILEVVQVLVQTPLIFDGLRRCSNSRELRREKPGRELLTFLIVCNVALWITQTFEVKSHGLQDHREEFYGEELWTIIGHMCIPFMMFYRFHSSVCIADIWKCAYEPTK